jgi:hypothetical protein
LLDDTDNRTVAPSVAADLARGSFGQRAARRAELDAFAGANDGIGQLLCIGAFGLDEVQGDAFRGARADARQAIQRGDEGRDGFGNGHEAT